MLNVRLTNEEEKKIKEYTTEHDVSKTTVVKEALANYFTKSKSYSSYELGEDLFGQEGSGNAKASVSYKDQIRKDLDEKYSR